MNCPKCDSSKFYYIQRVYEYHGIDYLDDDGTLLLTGIEDAVVDSNYSPYIYCEGCKKQFDLKLKEIEQLEEECVPIDIGDLG